MDWILENQYLIGLIDIAIAAIEGIIIILRLLDSYFSLVPPILG
jgi:hypothetical protein